MMTRPKPVAWNRSTTLEPIDDGLEPIDDGLEPVDDGLEPVDDGLEPVGGGLEPVDDGLEPIDSGLEPVDSGLEPVPPRPTAGLEPIDSGLEPIDDGQMADEPQMLPGEGRPAKKNQWDSTLLYVGGGVLGLMLIVGVAVFFLINRQSAGEMFKDADDAYRGQSYSQAIPKFEKYLAKFPDDPNASLARVKIGTAGLWQKLENRDKAPALQAAQETLPTIENEQAFSEVRAELATILPEIAAGFATPAKDEENVEQAQQLVDLAEQAMQLVNTPAYIPTSIRRPVEATISAIEEDIEIAKRNINRSKRLEEALAAIRRAAGAGETVQAFQIRRDLLTEYPELETNTALQSAVAVVTESEQSQVKVSETAIQPTTEDPPPAADFRLALASRPDGQEARVGDQETICFLARGAIYGLRAKTGELLWRRYVGYETTLHPRRLTPQADSDILAADLRQDHLLRLKAETGELVWACPIGEAFTDPILDGKQILVPALSGRLFVLDAETGASARSVSIPQPLSVGPGIGPSQRLYQVGQHSNVYVLDSQTLECREVFYLGHRDGTVVTPPIVTLGYVLIAENAGQDYCELHVLSTENGLELKPAMKPIRLAGRVVVPPLQSASRVIVVTDLGQVRMLEINTSNPEEPLMDVVDPLPASFRTPRLSYSVFDAGRLWIGNSRFSRYDIQTSRNRMNCPWIRNERDAFVAPPQVSGDVVFHLRRREGSSAYTASAINGDDGKAIWEIDLAVPLALVAVDMQKRQIHAINSQAELFEITTADFGSGRLDRPAQRVIGTSRSVPFDEAITLESSRWALASRQERHKVIVFDPAASTTSERLQARVLASVGDSQVTALPTAFQAGLLVPLDSGQVLLVDPSTGQDQVLPFQPRVEAGRKIQWRRPAVIDNGSSQFVITDDRKKVYRVGVQDTPQKHLVGLAETELQQEIASELAVAGDTIYGVVHGASSDTVISLAAEDLAAGKEWPVDGRVVWGPERVGQLVLLATDGKQLLAYDRGQQQKWTAQLKHGPLAGTPLLQDGQLILTSVNGTLWQLSAEDGTEGPVAEIGEPLGAGAVPFAGRLLLSGSDGTLLVVPAL
jgi:outer membrane protein assembly factor BamB